MDEAHDAEKPLRPIDLGGFRLAVGSAGVGDIRASLGNWQWLYRLPLLSP